MIKVKDAEGISYDGSGHFNVYGIKKITPDQAKQRADAVCRQKAYLYRLHELMEKRGVKPSDPLYQKVAVAYDGVFRLWIDPH